MKILIILLLTTATTFGQGYHKWKDAYVNKALDSRLVDFEYYKGKNYEQFTMLYDSCKFMVYHTFHIDYESKDHWEYFCTKKDGSDLIIDENMESLLVSNKTLERIKSKCYDYKQKHYKKWLEF